MGGRLLLATVVCRPHLTLTPTRFHIQEVLVRVSPGSLQLHPLAMSLFCSDAPDVHLVRQCSRLGPSPIPNALCLSCRGLRVLVDLLDEDYADQTDLVVHALNGIGSVFDLHSPTPKNDFCRMFIREGLLDPLSSALLNVMASRGDASAEMKTKIIQIILVFCQVSQQDFHVRNALGTRKVVRSTRIRGRDLPASHWY
jgi:hypothetical protein